MDYIKPFNMVLRSQKEIRKDDKIWNKEFHNNLSSNFDDIGSTNIIQYILIELKKECIP